MTIVRRQPLLVAIAVIALIWLAISPYIVLWQISNAAKTGDSDAISALVDFPSDRESVKGSLMAVVTKSAADASKLSSGSASLGAGLGLLFAGPMINTMIDGMVTPQGISNAIKTGKVSDPTQGASAQEAPSASNNAQSVQYKMHYVSFDRFAVNVVPVGENPFIEARLCRVNVFGWKLCSVSFSLPSGSAHVP